MLRTSPHRKTLRGMSKFRYKRFLAIYFIAVLSGCASPESISIAETRWKTKIEKFQPIGKGKKDLFSWLRGNDVRINSSPREAIILESIAGNGFVCSKWYILLSIDFDATESIKSYNISSAGTCL